MKAKSSLINDLKGSLSQGLSGETINARMLRKKIIIQKKPQPSSNTPSQDDWRTLYSQWCSVWNTLAEGEKAAYQTEADKKNITAFNEFLSEKLKAGVSPEQKYEWYTTDADTWTALNDPYFSAQSFTIGTTGDNEGFNLTKIKLLFKRTGSPGDYPIEIQGATEFELPDGNVLSTGTVQGNLVTTAGGGEWITVDMTSVLLEASTQYCIVIKQEDADASNYLEFREDATSAAYTGGLRSWTDDAGNTWWALANWDIIFEVWGIVD